MGHCDGFPETRRAFSAPPKLPHRSPFERPRWGDTVLRGGPGIGCPPYCTDCSCVYPSGGSPSDGLKWPGKEAASRPSRSSSPASSSRLRLGDSSRSQSSPQALRHGIPAGKGALEVMRSVLQFERNLLIRLRLNWCGFAAIALIDWIHLASQAAYEGSIPFARSNYFRRNSSAQVERSGARRRPGRGRGRNAPANAE